MAQLVGVPSDAIHQVWPQVEPLVAHCLHKAKEHRWNADDILALLLARNLQLYIIEQNNQIVSIVLTELVSYPRCMECNVFMWSGISTEDSKEHLDQLTRWARNIGCDYISSRARRGLVKYPGWEERQTYIVGKLK